MDKLHSGFRFKISTFGYIITNTYPTPNKIVIAVVMNTHPSYFLHESHPPDSKTNGSTTINEGLIIVFRCEPSLERIIAKAQKRARITIGINIFMAILCDDSLLRELVFKVRNVAPWNKK